MDLRDQIILDHAPLIAVPRYRTNLPAIGDHSHRFLAAEDGLWLDVRRPWLVLRHPVAVSEIPLPYGPIAGQFREFAFEDNAIYAIILMFITDARDALPNEAAGWAVWNATDKRLHYRTLEADRATPGGITYQRPVLAPHESLAIDLHSHGEGAAFWSATDDEDDTGEVKLAVVVGEINDTHPAIRIRLCALGLFIDLESPL